MTRYPMGTASDRPFLVAVGDSHALVDAANGRIIVLNAEGARCWQTLAEGTAAETPGERAFLAELARLGLAPASVEPVLGRSVQPGEPRILAEAPLQVAANTSDPNPFSADSSW